MALTWTLHDHVPHRLLMVTLHRLFMMTFLWNFHDDILSWNRRALGALAHTVPGAPNPLLPLVPWRTQSLVPLDPGGSCPGAPGPWWPVSWCPCTLVPLVSGGPVPWCLSALGPGALGPWCL
jgi:hypothetical protein